MTTNWTEQERKIAYQNLLERCQDFGDFELVGDEVLEAATDLSCERNAMRDALERTLSRFESHFHLRTVCDVEGTIAQAKSALAKCK
jgi:hypothetical protein